MLDALRPVLWRRAAALDPQVLGDALVLSTFGAHYRLPVTADGFGPVVVGGPDAVAGRARRAGRGAGPAGRAAARAARVRRRCAGSAPTCTATRSSAQALFPPVTADVLSYYLPW